VLELPEAPPVEVVPVGCDVIGFAIEDMLLLLSLLLRVNAEAACATAGSHGVAHTGGRFAGTIRAS